MTDIKKWKEENSDKVKAHNRAYYLKHKPIKPPKVLIDPVTNPIRPIEQRLASHFQNYGTVQIIKPKTGYRVVRIQMLCAEPICQLLTSTIGGSYSFHKTAHNYIWQCQGEDAVRYCKIIYPHLTGLQKDLAQFFVDYTQNAASSPTKIIDERPTYTIWLKRIKNKVEQYIPFHPVNMEIQC